MSLEALWTMQYRDAGGWQSGGVVVLETGRLFGGDSSFYFIGGYNMAGDKLTAKAAVEHYDGSNFSAFGVPLKSFSVEGEFTRKGNLMEGYFWQPGNPSLRLPILLTRRADLP
ncbi:MAG TPA: GrlR family regulatory protein [Dongiaceae bacterium]|nr:GrlR family regulatory protein [Dongiaceae bacterium]